MNNLEGELTIPDLVYGISMSQACAKVPRCNGGDRIINSLLSDDLIRFRCLTSRGALSLGEAL